MAHPLVEYPSRGAQRRLAAIIQQPGKGAVFQKRLGGAHIAIGGSQVPGKIDEDPQTHLAAA